ncbi:MAG: chondroitin synthase [Parasphingorhabdus sp.]
MVDQKIKKSEIVRRAREASVEGGWALAVETWQQCIDLFSTGEQPWWDANLGRALFMNEEFERAEVVLSKLRHNHPDNLHGHLHLATMKSRQEKFDEAAVVWKYCIDHFSGDLEPEWYLNLAHSLLSCGENSALLSVLEEAEGVLEKNLLHDPNSEADLVALAKVYTMWEKWDMAQESWSGCIEYFDASNKPQWYMSLIHAAINCGRIELAEDAALASIKLYPEFHPVFFKAAEVLMFCNKGREAKELWRRYTDGNRVDKIPRLTYAICLNYVNISKRLGFLELARQAWLTIFSQFSENMEDSWCIKYADVLFKLEEYEEARPLFKQVYEKDPESIDAVSALLAISLKLEEFSDCLCYATKLQRLDPERLFGHQAARDALVNLGRFEEAEVAQRNLIRADAEFRIKSEVDIPQSWPEAFELPKIQGAGNDYAFLEPLFEGTKKEHYALSVSVIIPVYNRFDMLSKTLAGLVHQSYPRELMEVIIADDGSNDNPELLIPLFESYFRIKIVQQDDQGYRLSKVRNLGISASSNDFIVMLDSDMVPGIGLIESIMKRFHVRSTLGIFGLRQHVCIEDLGYQQILLNPKIIDQFQPMEPDWKAAFVKHENGSILDHRVPFLLKTNRLKNSSIPFHAFDGCCHAFPKSIVSVIGGYDESFEYWGSEDIEFGYRLYNQGFYFVPVEESLGYHQLVDQLTDHGQVDRESGLEKTRSITLGKCPTVGVRESNSIDTYEIPKVSVFVVTHNSERTITNVLNSILNQTFRDFEIVVFDDGSIDKTLDILRTHYINQPRVRWITQNHEGFAKAANKAVSHCKGMYIAQLRATDSIDPEAIKLMSKTLDDGKLDMVYGSEIKMTTAGNIISQNSFGDFSRHKLLLSMACSRFRMFRRRDWSRITGFDYSMQDAAEYDLVLKLSEVCHIGPVPECIYYFQTDNPLNFSSIKASHPENKLAAINKALERMGVSETWRAISNQDPGIHEPEFIDLRSRPIH